MGLSIDWSGVFKGPALEWLISGLAVTLAISLASALIATITGILLVSFRLSPVWPLRKFVEGFVGLFRNTPLLVQLLFWYFVGFGMLPLNLRNWFMADHALPPLPGDVSIFSPEFLASAWGVGIFIGVYLSEEIRAGLNAIPKGQHEAAASQGLSRWDTLMSVLLPQALHNAYQPVVGQYLILLKMTSFCCSIGLAEITYQTRHIESYNAHAFEAFAAGTLLYLALGFILEHLLLSKGGSCEF